MGTKKIKNYTFGLVKKMKRTISSNAIIYNPQKLNSKHNLITGTYVQDENVEKH